MSKLFSIVIPTFNSRRYIEECVQSALDQSYPNLEVIVDDNVSKDGTLELLKAKFGNDPRLKLCENTEDLNMPNGWNRGLARAQGDFQLLLHSDNVLHPKYVETVVNLMEKFDAHVVYSDCIYFEGETPENLFVGYPDELIFDRMGRGPRAVAETFRFQRMIPTSGLSFRKECFANRKPYDNRYRWDPDLEQVSWLAHTYGIVHVRHNLAAIRTHRGQAASWKDPSFPAQYRELLMLEHTKGLTERHHFLMDWASSMEFIANRLTEEGAPVVPFATFMGRWWKGEAAVLGYFSLHFLRRQKRILKHLTHWMGVRTSRIFGGLVPKRTASAQ